MDRTRTKAEVEARNQLVSEVRRFLEEHDEGRHLGTDPEVVRLARVVDENAPPEDGSLPLNDEARRIYKEGRRARDAGDEEAFERAKKLAMEAAFKPDALVDEAIGKLVRIAEGVR